MEQLRLPHRWWLVARKIVPAQHMLELAWHTAVPVQHMLELAWRTEAPWQSSP